MLVLCSYGKPDVTQFKGSGELYVAASEQHS